MELELRIVIRLKSNKSSILDIEVGIFIEELQNRISRWKTQRGGNQFNDSWKKDRADIVIMYDSTANFQIKYIYIDLD